MGRPRKDERAPEVEAAEDGDLVPGTSVTMAEALAALPKVDLEAFTTLSLEEAVEKNRSAVIARLYLRFLLGDKTSTAVVGKLNVEPFVAKARMRLLTTPNGAKAAEVTGPAHGLLDALMRGGVALPKEMDKGMEVLRGEL